MKFAEALILSADNQKRIEQLKARLFRNAKVQDGESPGEIPEDLIKEFEICSEELTKLMQKINKTNSNTDFEKGYTLSDVLAKRDVLKIKQSMYNDLAKAATITQDRYSKSEVKFKSTVNI